MDKSWFVFQIYIVNIYSSFKDSKAMDKLRAAIMGKRGKNLDDLQFMTGTVDHKTVSIFSFI